MKWHVKHTARHLFMMFIYNFYTFFLLSFWFCLLEWLSMWYLSNDPFTSQKQTSRFIYCTKRQKYTACVQVWETWNKSEMLIFFFQIRIKWCGIDSFLYIFLWYTLFGFHTIMCSFSLHALCASGEKKLNFFSAVKFYESTCHFHSCLLIYIWMYKGSLVEVIRMCHSNYHLYFKKKTIIRHFHCMRRQCAWSKQKQKDRDQCWIQTIQLSIKTLWVE